MNWSLTKFTDGVQIGVAKAQGTQPLRTQPVTGLMPGHVQATTPAEEAPAQVRTFLNKFLEVEGNYPRQDFRMTGWVAPAKNQWWMKLTSYILEEYSTELKNLHLYDAIRATQYGFSPNVAAFYGVLEMYNPYTGTFFTPVGELGLALHEMAKISALPMGSLPYEEYYPLLTELNRLNQKEPIVYEIYRELMCHFYICRDIYHQRGNVNTFKTWAEYLFLNLEGKSPVRGLIPPSLEVIRRRMERSSSGNIVLDRNDGNFVAGNTVYSYHFQAQYKISNKALLAGYLALWLKRCVIPSWPRDGISPTAIFPAVQLVFGRPLGLLPAMVCSIQRGLRKLTFSFCKKEIVTRGEEQIEMPKGGPNPRIELPYSYLMAWFAMHCPALMRPGPEPGHYMPYLCRFEKSKWEGKFLPFIRRKIRSWANYAIYTCFPQMPGLIHGADAYRDDGRDATELARGPFDWLLSIRPSHLVYRSSEVCYLEPYMPSRFARQFGYDQLYIGNPNPLLSCKGNLIDGARAWRYFIMGCTGARFQIPDQAPLLLTSLGFCNWYVASNTTPPNFNINHSALKVIEKEYQDKRKAKAKEKSSGKPGTKEQGKAIAPEGSAVGPTEKDSWAVSISEDDSEQEESSVPPPKKRKAKKSPPPPPQKKVRTEREVRSKRAFEKVDFAPKRTYARKKSIGPESTAAEEQQAAHSPGPHDMGVDSPPPQHQGIKCI